MGRTLKAVNTEPGNTASVPAKNNLAMAISNVSAAAEEVAKNGRNTFHNYNFATAPDVIRSVKALMHQHHIIITQDEISCEMLTPEVMRCGYAFTVEHTISGETKVIKASGMAKVSGDKKGFNDRACQAIATTAYKYTLIRLFNLVVDLPDVDASNQGEGKPKTLTKQQAAGMFKQLGDDLWAITNMGDLQQFGEDHGVTIATLPEEWQKVLRLRYAEKLRELKPDANRQSAGRPLTVVPSPKQALQQPKGKGTISQQAINKRAQRIRQAQQWGTLEGEVAGPFDELPDHCK